MGRSRRFSTPRTRSNLDQTQGTAQTSGLLILQGSTFYVMRTPYFVVTSYSGWTSQGVGGLVATDFWELGANGEFIPSSHPDFSATGAAMIFGYFRGDSGSGSYSSDCGIDNWYVDIQPVPVPVPGPGCAAALSIGLALAGRRRR